MFHFVTLINCKDLFAYLDIPYINIYIHIYNNQSIVKLDLNSLVYSL